MIQIKNYSKEDLIFLTNNYHSMSVKDLSSHLDKSEGSIHNAVKKLGLKKQIHKVWTDEENQYLVDNYIESTSEEMAKHLKRTIHSINAQKDNLGLVRHKSWTNDEIKFLKENYLKMEYLEIGKILHRTDSAVRAKCFDLDLYKKEKPWEEWEYDFVRNNYMEMSKNEISEILNRTCDAIQIKASRMGLKKSPYHCNYHFFDSIDTEAKAYWLGFLMADGWISKRDQANSGVVGLEVQYSDICHLKKFNKTLGGNYRITDQWKKCNLQKSNTEYHSCCLRIFSLTMYNSLVKQGLSNKKSYEASIPKIRFDLQRHFVRGFFDGDGCFGISSSRLWVGFATASKTMKEDLIKLCSQNSITLADYYEKTGNDRIIYRPQTNTKSDKLRLLDYMYDNCTIYLDRKFKKYLKAKRLYATQ